MRTLDPILRSALERANPAACDIVEISAPDAQLILRRANDQFFSTPPRVSETPGASSVADANGAIILTPTNTQIASFYTENTTRLFGATVDPSKIIQGVGWTIDPAYGRVVLKKFTARVKRNGTTPIDLQLHIYRPKIQRVYLRNPATGAVEERYGVTFVDILPDPVIVRYASLAWVANHTDVVFDLSNIRPEIAAGPMLASDPVGEYAPNPHYIFEIDPVNPPKGGILEWKIDQTTSTTVAGVGKFQDITWTRLSDKLFQFHHWNWGIGLSPNEVPCFKLEIETYAATSAIVYAITLPSVPLPASTGRIVFERGVPAGTSATLEISTAGTGGPWTAVKHGDVVATKQLTYHLRLTLGRSASTRQTPRVAALGIDFRVPIDFSAEATVEPVAHEIQLPWCTGGIGQGKARIVRAGRRDYRDVAADLAVSYPTSKLECDLYVGSRHPAITRDRWFHLDRAAVTNRDPSDSAETFGLLSPLKALKRKIPPRTETISAIYVVVSSTTGQIVVTTPPNLPGAAGTGDYLGKGYYVRVRESAQLAVGYVQTIDDNTGTNTLVFSTPLPAALIAGDVIEIHSAKFTRPARSWTDADPADIWWEILTTDLLMPAERIGFGGAGQASRSGLPPKVTDRAPGDATTQAKLKVTIRLQEEEDGDKVIDQLSFLMGGCTVAIAGQIVFRQIFPLLNAVGDVVVPTAPPTLVLDARDYTGLQTPTGVEGRITTLSCDYGVNSTLVSDETQAAKTVVFADGDAIAYLAAQDVEGLGSAAIAKDIARWCFNSADEGLYLATQLTKQVVTVASTGLRAWPFTAVDQHPELHVGDAVTIVTDQYTDYDPTRRVEIRGFWAFRAIVVSVQNGGRHFRVLIPGLGAAVPVKGGTGTLGPLSLTLAELDARYVKKAGDTMSGTLDLATEAGARLIAPVGTDKWAT